MKKLRVPCCHGPLARLALALLLSGVALGSRPARASDYTFEGLSPGALQGQDNWTTNGQGTVSGVVVTTPLGTGNSSTRVIEGDTPVLLYSRINNGSFAIPALSSSRPGIFQLDVRLSATGGNYAYLGVGHDANADGLVTTSEIGFRLGAVVGNFDLALHSGPDLSTAFPGRIGAQDWLRILMNVDFSANGGNGSGSVFYEDLTLGDTTFAPVSGFQNLNLGLGTAVAVSTWDAMVVDVRNGSQVDNLLVESIPEPSTVFLLLVGGLMVWPRRRCP